MTADPSRDETASEVLDAFFTPMREHLHSYNRWTGKSPTKLFINPDIIGKLARVEGFYQRKELSAGQVTAYAPVIRYLKLSDTVVVTLIDDLDEPFYHFA